MSNLSSEEKQKLAQFKEVTNFDDETQRDKVLRLLEVCNWNLDRACARYFDNDFPSLLDDRTSNDISHEATQMFSPPTRASSQIQFREALSADSPFSIDQMNFDGRLLDIIPKLPRAMTIANKWKLNLGIAQPQLNGRDGGFTIFTPIVFVLMVIPKLLWALGWGLDRILGSTFPKLFHFLGFRDGPGDFPLKPMHETKEEISTYNVKDCIDNTLGETSDLHIFKGEFNEAFADAKGGLKWMMCILIDSQSDVSRKFIKTYLNDSHFLELLKKHDVILYIGDVQYPEPHEVGSTYRAYSIPYLNIIGNVSSSDISAPSMSIVFKCQSFGKDSKQTPEGRRKYFRRMNRAFDRYEPQLVAQRADKEEAEFARVLREQQDSAYQESLLRDEKKHAEKEKRLREEQQKKEEVKRIEEAKELEAKQRKAFLLRYIREKYTRDTTTWKAGSYTRIQIRDDKGKRNVWKFDKNDTIYDLFMFVETARYLFQLAKKTGKDEGEVKAIIQSEKVPNIDTRDYQLSFTFDLISPLNRLRLTADRQKLIHTCDYLWPNGSLLVEKADDESSDNTDSTTEEDD
ncbi:hypothetical protein HII12_003274 [Brettanomyces bruxellensis]|uniref:UBX domain-containing protein n=1 Tax=Dekkera bruxellensis TaxID=5007 RepID=A0A8H6ETD9_DEKBR|nr:hypothetical protein HII12_003274 [Brettanomyces bruxellensis]